MPELPEVEVLVRHLKPLLRGKTVRGVIVRRSKVIAPMSAKGFECSLAGARFTDLFRRGKYLVFKLQGTRGNPFLLVGHLGMTGRMYLAPRNEPWPRHCSVAFRLGRRDFIFEDTRYFGRFTLAPSCLDGLGPEPLGPDFTPAAFAQSLERSRQSIKVKLLDQRVVAGVGNIYASEALFRAGIAPDLPARALNPAQVKDLWQAVRGVLQEAIECGSTVPLDFSGTGERDGLFYFGRAPGALDYYEEKLQVYDRESQPCPRCGTAIRWSIHGGRSTYSCPRCQPPRRARKKPRATEAD